MERTRTLPGFRSLSTNPARLAALGLLVMLPCAAHANESCGKYAWQLSSAADRALALAQLEAMSRRAAGGFGPTSNYDNTYINGDRVNCSVSAQAVGNTGTTGVTGSAASPGLANRPDIFAQVTGSSVGAQGFPAVSGGSLASPLNSSQTNTNIPQSASVSATTSALNSNGLGANGGRLSQFVLNTQGNTASPQTATVSGSTACAQAGSSR